MICKTTMISIALLLVVSVSVPLAAQDRTEVLLSWPSNPEPDILRYIIYRSPDTTTAHFALLDSVGASITTYTDGSIYKGVIYYYRIKAKNGTGTVSPFSNGVSIFAIPQNANSATRQLCQITTKTKVGDGSYEITWTNTVASIGFVQYGGTGGFDNVSAWDNASYATTHTVAVNGLTPGKYYMRATAYDGKKNMVISAIDSIVVTSNTPSPLSAPVLSVYPVPYHPGMGSFQLDNLPLGGSATIYSESGVEVWHREVGNASSIQWNGTNKDGSRVMSGVYYVVIKDAGGKVHDKRPIMIVNK